MIKETVLEFSTEIQTTSKELFYFHVNFNNVTIVTPPMIKVRFLLVPERMEIGSKLIVEVNQFGFWLPWEITVEKLEPYSLMVDYQSGRGPFRSWRHEHIFQEKNQRTILTDRITYSLPFGKLGSIFNAIFMRNIQRLIFGYRHKKTKEYFQKND